MKVSASKTATSPSCKTLCDRVNNQWRIIFKWENGNAFEVEIRDYH